MALGLGGWTGKDVDFLDADELDLTFWTFNKNRLNGHVGALLRDRHGMPKVTHASTRKGVVLEDMHGHLLRNLTKVRRLTIGD